MVVVVGVGDTPMGHLKAVLFPKMEISVSGGPTRGDVSFTEPVPLELSEHFYWTIFVLFCSAAICNARTALEGSYYSLLSQALKDFAKTRYFILNNSSLNNSNHVTCCGDGHKKNTKENQCPIQRAQGMYTIMTIHPLLITWIKWLFFDTNDWVKEWPC
jgi:hypothetical protein